LPQSVNEQGYYLHVSAIPGLAFFLTVGQRLPDGFLRISTAPAPKQFLAIYPAGEWEEMLEIAKVVQSARTPKGYKGP
jgi:hypothetical protein